VFGFLCDVYQIPGVSNTYEPSTARTLYYQACKWLNPTGIVALGPNTNWHTAHNREHFPSKTGNVVFV